MTLTAARLELLAELLDEFRNDPDVTPMMRDHAEIVAMGVYSLACDRRVDDDETVVGVPV